MLTDDRPTRYQLLMPRSVYGRMQEAANARHLSVTQLLKKCAQVGMVIEAMMRDGKRIYARDESGNEQEIVWGKDE